MTLIDQGAKLEPSPPPRVSVQLLSHFPRVLTATAKGMEHWSKYKAQTPMLFEIFGSSDSLLYCTIIIVVYGASLW